MMLRSALSAALLASTALAPAVAQTKAGKPRAAASQVATPQRLPIVEIPHEKIVLANGLTVIVHEDHNTPVVSVGMWYHVGSGNETAGRTGLAHLFEHLMFNGSEHANTDWFKAMNEVGATEMNGTTGFDRTNYYQTVPKNALDRVLWLESDRMENLLPVVDQARLDEQRKVVQNEKRQRANNPLGELPDMLYAATHPVGHPYRTLPIGSMEDLNAASLDDVRAFFKRWYSPNNAVLVLSGDITAAEARDKVERYFGNIPAGPALSRGEQQIARMTGESRGRLEASTANSQIYKVWNVPGWNSRDVQLLQLAGTALSDGESSRFRKRLVRDLKLASDVEASVTLLELGSQFTINATARPGVSLERLEAAINEEMALFLRDGLTSAELERTKFRYYTSAVRSQTSTFSKGLTLAEAELYAGDSNFYRKEQEIIYSATSAEILAVARDWLRDGAYVLEVHALPQYKLSGKQVDRTKPPAIGPAFAFALPPLQTARLSNGIKVMLAERYDVPTVNLSMIFDVGSLPDRNPASAGLGLAPGLTTSGTTTRSKLEISARQQELGANIGWQTSNEFTRFGASALKIKLDETLDLYADVLLNPTFPQEEWDRTRELFALSFEENKRNPLGKISLTVPRMTYGENHPYAIALTPEITTKITVTQLRDFYRRWIRPDLATILIVGDTTLAEIMPKLEQRLAGWKAPAGPPPVKAPLPAPTIPTKPRVVLVDQPNAASSIIALSQTGPAHNDPDYDALSVANTIVGGYFMSRLNMNLREEKGWSYGAKTSLDADTRLGSVTASTTVQADKSADALREMDRELRELTTIRPPSAAEIGAARNAMLLGLPAKLQGSGGMLGFYRDAFEDGLPADYWSNYVQRLQGLTPAQINAAAKRLFRPSEFTWFVIGDLAKIEAGIRKLNLGEVMVYDADGKRVR
ncbi:MAG: insulinase family protein [Sphingomonadales bacterium]|nr:MAG: insulinase family protein [Sphingomonadales bacterium]